MQHSKSVKTQTCGKQTGTGDVATSRGSFTTKFVNVCYILNSLVQHQNIRRKHKLINAQTAAMFFTTYCVCIFNISGEHVQHHIPH